MLTDFCLKIISLVQLRISLYTSSFLKIIIISALFIKMSLILTKTTSTTNKEAGGPYVTAVYG